MNRSDLFHRCVLFHGKKIFCYSFQHQLLATFTGYFRKFTMNFPFYDTKEKQANALEDKLSTLAFLVRQLPSNLQMTRRCSETFVNMLRTASNVWRALTLASPNTETKRQRVRGVTSVGVTSQIRGGWHPWRWHFPRGWHIWLVTLDENSDGGRVWLTSRRAGTRSSLKTRSSPIRRAFWKRQRSKSAD